MKSFPKNGLRAVAVVAVAQLLSVALWAGEALQLSTVRSLPDPNQKSALPDTSPRTGLKLGPLGPMEQVSPGMYQSRRRDPRAERKAQNAEDEKKNWMVLDPGQLDAEDEDSSGFGIKNYDLDKKNNAKRDYFFDPPEQKGNRAGQARSQLGRPSGKNRAAAEDGAKESSRNAEQGDKDGKANASSSKDGRPVGEHVSKELDLKDLLSPGKANSLAPAGDKTAKLWREVLGSPGTKQPRTEPAGERGDALSGGDGFRQSAAPSFSPQASSPTFGFRNDFISRPAAASSPSISGSPSTGFTPPSVPLAPRPADPYVNRQAGYSTTVPTPNDSYGSRQDAFGQGGFGQGAAGSSFNQPPPRRAPSSGFEIPARPGYGGR